jgi:hypothetical protein
MMTEFLRHGFFWKLIVMKGALSTVSILILLLFAGPCRVGAGAK